MKIISGNEGPFTFSLYDTMGRLYLTEEYRQLETFVPINHLNPGVYFVHINSDKLHKVIKS